MKSGSFNEFGQILVIAGIACLVPLQYASAAEAWSEWGVISVVDAGWKEDTVAVHHAAPTVNPDACPFPEAGYATNPEHPGHNLFHTVILSAFMNRKEVHFLISGCAFGKPGIIGVGVR